MKLLRFDTFVKATKKSARTLALLLFTLAWALPASAQISFGPMRAGDQGGRAEHSALSIDAAGQADVVWVERMITGRPAALPILPSARVRLELADGGVWEADLARGPPISLDGGRLSSTELYWATLKRAGQPDLLGVHLIAERRADSVIVIGIKVSNGAIDPANPNAFPGGIYFKRLSLAVDNLRIIPELLRAGETLPREGTWILADGNHYFPPRAQFNRRAALVPGGRLRFDADLWSARARQALDLVGLVMPSRYVNFGAAKLELPQIDRQRAAAFCSQRRAAIFDALTRNVTAQSVGLYVLALGPFMPSGYDVPGAASGEGIEAVGGWEQSREGALSRRIEHDVTTERMPIAFFDKATGVPLAKLPSPQDYRITRGFGKSTSLVWTVRGASDNIYDDRRIPKDWNSGVCAYRDRLLQYQAIDGQHLCRATRHAEAAWWLGRDWLARLDLEMTAADARYSWTLHGLAMQPQYSYYPFSLKAALDGARAKPGNGSPALGREFGWVGNAWALDLAASGGLLPRADKKAHGKAALELAAQVAMPTGITQRLQQGEFWGSPDPWTGNGVPANEAVSQWVMEGPKVAHGLVGLMRTAVSMNDPWAMRCRDVVVKWARSAYLNPAIQTKPSPYNSNVMGIPKWGFVGKAGGPAYDTVPRAMGEGDPTSSWHHLALAWELTGDVAFLDAMNKLGGPTQTRAQRIASFNVVDLRDLSAALSALQRAAP